MFSLAATCSGLSEPLTLDSVSLHRRHVFLTATEDGPPGDYDPLRELFGDSSADGSDDDWPGGAPGGGGMPAGPLGGAGSSASGSGDAMPPPPPPALAPEDTVRGKADIVVRLHGFGQIAYYKRYDRFQATCEKHDSCRLSRASRPKCFDPTRPARGRPLGLMAVWLLSQAHYDSKADHHNVFSLALLATGMEDRRDARNHLLAMPGGEELSSYERPRRKKEPVEEVGLP